MGRKAVNEGKKREEIIDAAFDLIFSQGFDGTSVRSIMKRAGGEVGLFYYYFESKDEVFGAVLDRFFNGYQKDFDRILEQGRRNPCRLMWNFFIYMQQETERFRENYEEHIHRTIRWAIREHTLEIIEPYIRQIVDIQSSYYGIAPALEPEVAAVYLTYGVGSAILHENGSLYEKNRPEIQKGTSLIMNMPVEEQALRIPRHAQRTDLPGILALLSETAAIQQHDGSQQDRGQQGHGQQDSSSYWEQKLLQHIDQQEVWVYRAAEQVAAAAVFESETQTISLLIVAPKVRGMGMAHRLLETISAQLPVGSRLYARVPDFEGQEAAFYRHFGMEDAGDGRLTRLVPELL